MRSIRNPLTTRESQHSTSSAASSIEDLHTLPTSPILLLPTHRPGRKQWSHPIDPNPHKSYGDNIREKPKHSLRIFFQNVKGFSYSSSFDDYKYYFSSLKAYGVDIAGLAETNTAWQHPHLQQDVRKVVHKLYRQSKLVFGSTIPEIDKCAPSEVYQSGGTMTVIQGPITSGVYGSAIEDETGLGRWSGITLRGHGDYKLSIITAYRTCGGNIKTSSIGSVFSREYLYFRSQGLPNPNPRRLFFQHLGSVIQTLQDKGNQILLMLDANSDLSSDYGFSKFVAELDLNDLHNNTCSKSTYIGSSNRRIDYMFGSRNLSTCCPRSGSLSYFEGPQSDHRGLFIDLTIPAIISSLRAQPMSPSGHRVLHTGNPELVNAYLKSVGEYYKAHRMKERIDDLFSKHETLEKAEVLHLLSSWDNDQGRAMSAAENKLSKPSKKFSWSPTLRNTAMIRKYWKLRLREVTLHHCYHNTFLRWQRDINKYDPSFTFPLIDVDLTKAEIRQHFNAATKSFRKSQMDSTSLCLQTYEDLISKYLGDNDPMTHKESERKAKILLRTIQTETCRKTFGDICRVLNPSTTSGLSKVLIPHLANGRPDHSNTTVHELLRETPPEELRWDTVIDRSEIEKHLLTYNREAFRAAAASPCGHGIIYNSITFTSLSPSAKELLAGFVPSEWHGDDQVLKEFLASFVIPETVLQSDLINTTISEDEVKRGFQGWRETTTTSPSGRHLGHYKALVTDPMLLQCLTKFLNIALYHGISLPRWSHATNVLLEKDPGEPKINRLRIIHLFEADFNFLLKILWGSRLVQQAVDFDLLHDGQFGSVPRKTTMDLIMLTQLTTDLSRIQKLNMARFENDASACYDRIIVAFGMLAARRCGMPPNAVSTHASALQFMRYSVKTIYGVSEATYTGTEFEPLFGTGQGSGASPAVWLSLVVLLLRTLEKLVPDRIMFESPSRQIQQCRLVDAYVDDTSLGLTDNLSDSSLEEMIARLQIIAQTWEHLLSLSGGALNFKKCSWYVVYWDWENGRPRLRPIKPDDPTITLCTSVGPQHAQEIPRMPTEASSRVLGVHLSPSGDFSDMIRLYKKKADQFAARLHSPQIRASEARIFHRSIYVPTMRYGLAALVASDNELAGVQSRVLASILQKLNISKSLPTAIRHSPLELGGLALYDLRTEIGIENIKFLRDAIFANSSAGKLILLNLQYHQLEAGIAEPLLEQPTVPVPYLTPSWLLSVRKFLAKHNMSITLTEQPTIQKTSHLDQFIMQPEHLKRYSLIQQTDLNLVRIYLQVNTLADMIDTSQPNKISLFYLDGHRPPQWVETLRWPRQAPPSPSQRRLWKRFIVSSYLRYIPYWKQPPICVTPDVPRSVFLEVSPPNHNPEIGRSMTLQEYLQTLPRTQRRMVSAVEQVATDVQVWRAFRSRERLHIASDGGLHEQHGTFGWVLATSKHILFKCGGPVDGPFDTVNGASYVVLLLPSS